VASVSVIFDTGGMEEVLSGYSGRGDFTRHVKDLMHSLLSMPRQALTQHNLSERTWSVCLTSLTHTLTELSQ